MRHLFCRFGISSKWAPVLPPDSRQRLGFWRLGGARLGSATENTGALAARRQLRIKISIPNVVVRNCRSTLMKKAWTQQRRWQRRWANHLRWAPGPCPWSCSPPGKWTGHRPTAFQGRPPARPPVTLTVNGAVCARSWLHEDTIELKSSAPRAQVQRWDIPTGQQDATLGQTLSARVTKVYFSDPI